MNPSLLCGRGVPPAIVGGLVCGTLLGIMWGPARAIGDEYPRTHDARLELTLFAEDPEIVTPVGMAIDPSDRLFVIESHTHLPPSDYDGPELDRIKVFVDEDGDGRCDRSWVCASGINEAMNLAFSPDGTLFVACSREVLALIDHDQDGICDQKRRIVKLATTERYPHNSLLGITFDNEGRLYLSRGNLSSRKYAVVGSDGSMVAGYGDGGNIVTCRPDGSQVEEFATGFWNPFDIKFDYAGRLLCVDNDPDARGPNRLLHVVRHGDYGYKSLYGGSGNHPFQGWEGKLPGTLPMVSGTGEAPSGLLDGRRTSLAADYHDAVLVTVWNENTIECHTTRPQGASLVADRSVMVSGGKDFRPVAIDSDSRGNVYITDWVLVDYPNHGRGRIWRLAAKDPVQPRRPSSSDGYEPSLGQAELGRLYAAEASDAESLAEALQGDDPFLRHAATIALSKPSLSEHRQLLTEHDSPQVRLGALFASWRSGSDASAELARKFLHDQDARVRQAALMWAGREMMMELRPDLEIAIEGNHVSVVLFETYLAALEQLNPTFLNQYKNQAAVRSRDIPRVLDDELLASIAQDTTRPSRVRALAIARLDDLHQAGRKSLLERLALAGGSEMQLAAVRKLAGIGSESADLLSQVARDRQQPADVRCEALLSLTSILPADRVPDILRLIEDPSLDVQLEAIRCLRSFATDETVREALQARLELLSGNVASDPLRELIEFTLSGGQHRGRPASKPAWEDSLSFGGDPQRGRRVFYSPHTTCSKCHTVGGLGGTLGPDLSGIGKSAARQRIIRSVVEPSEQFAPRYQAWFVATVDGKSHIGLQLDHKARGAIELFTVEGAVEHYDGEEVDFYDVLPRSVMPDDLQATMTVSEFRDLVAFLESLQ